MPAPPQLRPGFTIRRLHATEEYHAAEELQGAAWGILDRVDITPAHVLVTAQKNGGLVLGAFEPGGEMVGFLFGFLGTTADGNLKHVSHQMGVHPQYRGLNLGYLLKRAQRGEVRRQGLDLITWTYDPLETVNASLNLTQLGAVNSTYLRNVYGEIRDSLNRGLPSDRFQVDWWVRSQWVHERLSQAHAVAFERVRRIPIANPARRWPGGLGQEGRRVAPPAVGGPTKVGATGGATRGATPLLAPGELDTGIDALEVLIQVPYLFQAVKAADLDLALAWRMHTRQAFEHYFGLGYSAVEMLRGDLGEVPVAFYRLVRLPTPPPWRVEEHTPAEDVAPLPEALTQYARLYNAGLYWKAHEALEAAWGVAEGQDKDFLQGLIRAAAAFHKLMAHENPRGAERHLAWVVETLEPLGETYQGVQLGPFVAGLRYALAAVADLREGDTFDSALIPPVKMTMQET